MKKIQLLFLIFFYSWFAFGNLKYNQTQMEQFMITNRCQDCDLSNGSLDYGGIKYHSNASLKRANLTDMINDDFIVLKESDLSYAIMSRTQLRHADIRDSNLLKTILVGADLSYSNLSGSDCAGAAFYDADLSHTNMRDANITEAQLRTAKSLCGATLPDGTIGKCH